MLGRRLAERPIVATLGWHLGATRHMDAREAGYDQAAEDRLLDDLDWEHDGYRLFSAATLAASSARGWFRPMGESNGLFMPAALWRELGGLDEGFALPGGGLSNHDLFRRACELDRRAARGAARARARSTRSTAARRRRAGSAGTRCTPSTSRGAGTRYQPPQNERLYVGTVPDAALEHVEHSAQRARELPPD